MKVVSCVVTKFVNHKFVTYNYEFVAVRDKFVNNELLMFDFQSESILHIKYALLFIL